MNNSTKIITFKTPLLSGLVALEINTILAITYTTMKTINLKKNIKPFLGFITPPLTFIVFLYVVIHNKKRP